MMSFHRFMKARSISTNVDRFENTPGMKLQCRLTPFSHLETGFSAPKRAFSPSDGSAPLLVPPHKRRECSSTFSAGWGWGAAS